MRRSSRSPTHARLKWRVLRPDGYDWRFRAVMGEPFEDTGTGTC